MKKTDQGTPRVKIRKDKYGYGVNHAGKGYYFPTLEKVRGFIANGFKVIDEKPTGTKPATRKPGESSTK